MSNRTEARSAKAACMHATGRLPLLRLFSTPLTIDPAWWSLERYGLISTFDDQPARILAAHMASAQ